MRFESSREIHQVLQMVKVLWNPRELVLGQVKMISSVRPPILFGSRSILLYESLRSLGNQQANFRTSSPSSISTKI